MTHRTIELASNSPAASAQSESEHPQPVGHPVVDKHLDKALKRSDVDRFEDAVDLWKIYGES